MHVLHFVDPSIQIERRLVSVDNIVIGGLQTPKGPPTTLQLFREVKLVGDCIGVAATNGDDIYVGSSNGEILRIDKQGCIELFLTTPSSNIVGLTIHGSILYTLNSKYGIYQIDLETMKQSLFFSHADKSAYRGSRMLVTQNQLVVADVTDHRLTLYSLTGQLIRHVACPLISTYWVSLCLSPSNPDVIIVSDWKSSRVFAVNLSTGTVVWANSDIREPAGIASFGSKFLMVSKRLTTTRLWVLNADTGV